MRSRPVAKQERVTIPALIKQEKPVPQPVSQEDNSGTLPVEQEYPDGKHMQEEAPPIGPEKQEVRNGPAPMPRGSLVSSLGQDDDASLYPKGEGASPRRSGEGR